MAQLRVEGTVTRERCFKSRRNSGLHGTTRPGVSARAEPFAAAFPAWKETILYRFHRWNQRRIERVLVRGIGEKPPTSTSALARCRMKRIILRRVGLVLWALDVQIHHRRLLSAAHDHRFHWLVFARVQLLMRNVRRDVHESRRDPPRRRTPTGFPSENAPGLAPHISLFPTRHDGAGQSWHSDAPHSSRPQLLRSHPRPGNGLRTVHARRLRRIAVQIPAADNAQTISPPIRQSMHDYSPAHRL
jgi:hypothetical protein